MKRVTIIQRILYQYRVDFYRHLQEALRQRHIGLQLIVDEDKSRDGVPFLDHFLIRPARRLNIGVTELLYQPYWDLLKDTDLIVMELGNRLLLNYFLQARRLMTKRPLLAFWGHTVNSQKKRRSIANRLKQTYLTRVDHWFPYTHGQAQDLRARGFAPERITTIENTLDTNRLRRLRTELSTEQSHAFRRTLGIANGPVGIFCGRMYPEKRIGFLLDACTRIHEHISGFTMILIGDGPDAGLVRAAAAEHPWLIYAGPLFEQDKARYFALADVFLSPGLVGLSVIDSFAFEVPLITTDYPYHSAEIDYLLHDENGIRTPDTTDAYVSEVISLLNDPARRERLTRGCAQAAERYTMENMVTRFSEGVVQCLG